MIDITKIQPTKVSLNPQDKHWLLAGIPKSGKSTFAAQIKDNLIIAFEHGTRFIAGAMVVEVKTWADFKQITKQLLSNPEAKAMYKSVTIDTISRAWDACGDYIVSQGKDANGMRAKRLGDIPWGGGYALRDNEFIKEFSMLETEYGINFLSHVNIEREKIDEGRFKTIITPAIPDRPAVLNYLNGTIDITMFITEVPKEDDSGTERVLVTRPVDNDKISIPAGGRLANLPPKIPLSYQAFTDAMVTAIKAQGLDNTTENLVVQEVTPERPFNEAMQEAKELFRQLDPEVHPVIQNKVLELMNNNPNKTRISEFEESDLDRLELIITEMKLLLGQK